MSFEYRPGFGQPGNTLWIMNADGSGKHRLPIKLKVTQDVPYWCSDGKHLVFAGTRNGSHPMLWLVETDGPGLKLLTPGVDWDVNEKWSEYYDFWTPTNHRYRL